MSLKYFDPTANGRSAESASDRFRRLKVLERRGGSGTVIIGGGGGSSDTPDASTTVKGKLQLSGVLGGTAAAPALDSTRWSLTSLSAGVGGQLQLVNPGATGGLKIGADTQLYRSASHTLRFDTAAGAASTFDISSGATDAGILQFSQGGSAKYGYVHSGSTHALSLRDLSGGGITFIAYDNALGTIQPKVRVNLWDAAPTVDPNGGQFGTGSNMVLSIGSSLDSAYSEKRGGALRVGMNLLAPQGDGNVGARAQRPGTVSKTGLNVVGVGTNFSGADVGLSFVAVEVDLVAGWRKYHGGTIGSVADATHLTLSTTYGGDAPAGCIYSIDQARMTTDYASGGWGTGYSTFYGGMGGDCIMNTLGSCNPFSFAGTINDLAAGGSDGYGELSTYNSHLTCNRKGALVTNEFALEVNSGKQARGAPFTIISNDDNAYSTYSTAGPWAVTSAWAQTGMRMVWIQNNNSVTGGTAIYITGASQVNNAFKRAFVYNNGGGAVNTAGTDMAVIDGAGRLGLGGPTTNQSQVLVARVTLGTTAFGTTEGIQFGTGTGLVNLYRSAANTLKLDDDFNIVGSVTADNFLFLSATDGTGYIQVSEQASVSAPAADRLRLYAKDVGGATHLFQRTNAAGAAGDIDLTLGGSGSPGTVDPLPLLERANPTPVADTAIHFSRDSGGKTQACVMMPSGTVFVLATDV